MNRYALSLVALVAGSLVLLAALLLAAPGLAPEKKGRRSLRSRSISTATGRRTIHFRLFWCPLIPGTSPLISRRNNPGSSGICYPGIVKSQIVITRGGVEYSYYRINRTDELDWGFLFQLENGTVYDATVIASSIMD